MLLFSCSVVSDSLRPHGLQHTRLPCSCSNSCKDNVRASPVEDGKISHSTLGCDEGLNEPQVFEKDAYVHVSCVRDG